MNTKLKLAACAVGMVSVVLLTALTLRSQPPDRRPRPEATGPFMRAKLASSQKVLEGLTVKKFALIRTGAKELQKMSDAAGWKRSNDAVYLHYSREFRRLADKLDRLAVDRNLEGASFTYMHLISTCLSCHEHSRDVLRIANDHEKQESPFRLLGKESDENAIPQAESGN